MTISAFTFAHNALEGGYPLAEAVQAVKPHIAEVVAVDLESTDGTRDLLVRLGCRVLDGRWWQGAGETLAAAHAMHTQCEGDTVLHFEADEVFDPRLVERIVRALKEGFGNLSVWRLQVEQNFQRIRWYPELVHRVFPKGEGVVKVGHTTNRHRVAVPISYEHGYLWDCANCFRDNWLARVRNQAWLWNEEPQYRAAPYHFKEPVQVADVDAFLAQPHWTWRTTPLDLPENLKHLVGMTKYDARV
jgi:hypothetical protein